MRREPSLTFEGALRILGQHEHKTIEKIDKLLGGVILGGGAVAGAVALGVTPLAPLAAFGVVWGWIEQKGLAVDLLKSAVDAVSGKISGLRGLEKRELIAAAHSTIVVASIFESLRDHVGEEFYRLLKITDEEKKSLIDRVARDYRDIGALYASEIPAPSAACGFEENLDNVAEWQAGYVGYVMIFLKGLAAAENTRIDWRRVRTDAVERYRSRYLELAAKVPEFAIWAQLGEHAATRTAVHATGDEVMGGIDGLGVTLRELNADVIAGFNANRDALNRVAALLSAGMHGTGGADATASGLMLGGSSALRQAVSRANAGILDERIIRADRGQYPPGVDIPRVSEIYINPRYRVNVYGDWVRPADERWWAEQESYDDFDVFLARHVASPIATRRPLLLLGHPGGGKSLLTKVFAARLPTSEYTVVRVPLRRVSADAEIHHQVEEALDISTHQRIAWTDLAEQSGDTVRVVLLDGLDELLQASEHDRSRYLEDVMDFQEREAMQRRPVVAVVTSRTVVVERVRIPDGTTIVKLDPFNDGDIADWLGRWKRVNMDAIAAGTMGELTVDAARRHLELAEQPLLLLMLTLYAADPKLPPLDEDVVTAELYRRLLDGFSRREAEKDLRLGRDPSPHELEQQARNHLDRLAAAALGMFNRGRQDISEEELGKDLEALDPRLMQRSRPAEAGQRIIGEFFFVHAPESRTPGRQARGGQSQRAYEFLHATFGEYLVAHRIMDELIEIAEKAFAGHRGTSEPNDDLLYALLSHRPLAVLQSTLGFAKEIFTELPYEKSSRLLEVFAMLIVRSRNRHDSNQYANYRPVSRDQVRALACYSANLVALRVSIEPAGEGLPLSDLLCAPEDAIDIWRSTVKLWEAGLAHDGLEAMLDIIEVSDNKIFNMRPAFRDHYRAPESSKIVLARLIGDSDLESSLRFGIAITAGFFYHDYNDASWADVMASWLIPAIAGISLNYPLELMIAPPPEGTTEPERSRIANLVMRLLRSGERDPKIEDRLLRFLYLLRP